MMVTILRFIAARKMMRNLFPIVMSRIYKKIRPVTVSYTHLDVYKRQGGTYSLHNEGFDDVCSNYTNDIKIIECTP